MSKKENREESLCLVYNSSILNIDAVPVKTPSGIYPALKRMDVAIIGFVRSEQSRFPVVVREAGKLISEQVRVNADRVDTALRIEGMTIKVGPVQELVVSDGVLIKVNGKNLGIGVSKTIIDAYTVFQERFNHDNDVVSSQQKEATSVNTQSDDVARKLDIATKAGVTPDLMIKASGGDPSAQKRVNELISSYQSRVGK